MKSKLRLLAPIVLLAALSGGGLLAWQSLAKRETAPPVSYVLLDGAKVDSAQWKGKVMLVKRYVGEPDFSALHQLVEQLLAEA